MEIRGGVTRRDEQRQTREDRATQPLGCWKAEFRNSKPAQNEKYQIWFTIDAQDAILAILTLSPI